MTLEKEMKQKKSDNEACSFLTKNHTMFFFF